MTLKSLSPCGEPSWQTKDLCGPQTQLELTVPVCAKLYDGCGKAVCKTASVHACICLPDRMVCAPRGRLFIQPDVRLLCAQEGSVPGTYHTQLCLTVDAWLLCAEAFGCQSRPACPPLPLYPPPMC